MSVIRATSLDDPRLDLFCRLTERQLRNALEPEKGIYIAESLKVIRLAVAVGAEPLALLMEDKWLARLDDVLPLLDDSVPVYVLPHEQIEYITGYNVTRGALMACRRPALAQAHEVIAGARRVAVLEDVCDPTNVGAAFRSAAALGVDALLLTPATADPLVRRALRVSMGTVLQVPWARTPAPWPSAGLELLRAQGFTTAALALSDDAVTIDDPRLREADKLALFLGTEGGGLARETITGCDFVATIPMMRGVDSLNLAAASAVAFWELCR
jgi:tRNA G18 (ribose-2'-O)-methylase SpoU